MRIKKYIASTLKEGRAKIKSDLGDNAVILSNRTNINSETGEEYVEIVAAVDNKPSPEEKPEPDYTPKKQPTQPRNKSNINSNEIHQLREGFLS